MIELTTIYGAVDGLTFEAIVVKKLVPQLLQVACVVMDNAKIHQDIGLKKRLSL